MAAPLVRIEPLAMGPERVGTAGETPYHPPVKRSVAIAGHKTSISLEPLFWDMLRHAAMLRGEPLNTLVARIDAERIASPTPCGLAAAIRLWLVADRFGDQPATKDS